jgi:hypothetical protein
MRCASRAMVVLLLLISLFINGVAQTRNGAAKPNGAKPKAAPVKTAAAVEESVDGKAMPVSEMRAAIERYTVDRGSLARSYPVNMSPARRDRFKKFYSDWLTSLQKLDFDSMSRTGKSITSSSKITSNTNSDNSISRRNNSPRSNPSSRSPTPSSISKSHAVEWKRSIRQKSRSH